MTKIYFDNSSTSFPKAPSLGKVIGEYIDNKGLNINRGLYEDSYSATSKIIKTRKILCDFFNGESYKNVIFTSGITQAINLVVGGLADENSKVITSNMEHNAVIRPLAYNNFKYITYIDVTKSEKMYLEEIEKSITQDTKFLIMSHESNVNGNMINLYEIGQITKKYNIIFIVDTAQSAGKILIDMKKFNIDILCFTGHKGLMGPQGIGGFVLSNSVKNMLNPINVGGSGIKSDDLCMPDILPERFEAGTLNLPGIIGLHHSMSFIIKETMEKINKHCEDLGLYFLEKIQNIDGLEIILPITENRNMSLVSINFKNLDNALASHILDDEYDIMVRCGLHCAFMAHKSIGTYPNGTIRFSFGYFNNFKEVDKAVEAINKICLLKEDEY
ncbi:MAG: aminotransferase class V-fold PLP-dependent enzyme [Lachnospirales bacterium]